MSGCGCKLGDGDAEQQRPVLLKALAANAVMAIVGLTVGVLGSSAGVLADALDMASDASAYAIALIAIGRSGHFKRRAAQSSGIVLLVLGLALLVESGRRAFHGSEPVAEWMVLAAGLSLVVNLWVLRLLRPLSTSGVHLRATWIFTRADVVANLGVIAAAALVAWTASGWPDLVIGVAIGCYIVKEAIEILLEARKAGDGGARPAGP
jgi:cation diffusion facilitator family transporter